MSRWIKVRTKPSSGKIIYKCSLCQRETIRESDHCPEMCCVKEAVAAATGWMMDTLNKLTARNNYLEAELLKALTQDKGARIDGPKKTRTRGKAPSPPPDEIEL